MSIPGMIAAGQGRVKGFPDAGFGVRLLRWARFIAPLRLTG